MICSQYPRSLLAHRRGDGDAVCDYYRRETTMIPAQPAGGPLSRPTRLDVCASLSSDSPAGEGISLAQKKTLFIRRCLRLRPVALPLELVAGTGSVAVRVDGYSNSCPRLDWESTKRGSEFQSP